MSSIHTGWLNRSKNPGIACLAGMLVATSSFAQKHETFASRPALRQEKASQARVRAEHDKEEARQWAATRGLKMRHVDGDRVSELMAIRNGKPIYYMTLNANAAISTAADLVRDAAPFNKNGADHTVAVWDEGPARENHQEFGGRVTLKNTGTTSSHSTHVSGTICASGVNAAAKGMAPGATVDSYDWVSDENEMISAAAAAASETNKIHISNHSYGIVCGWVYGSYSGNTGYHWYGDSIFDDESDSFGQYNSDTRYWDEIVYDAPYYLPFKAAGNDRSDDPPSQGTTFYYYSGGWQSNAYDSVLHPPGDGDAEGGFDTIQPKGNAKNIMTVGAVNDAVSGSNRSLVGASMTSFSGWGPADDGRIKPDIVANGVGLVSADKDADNDYVSKSGTSMATPNACGSAALLLDYYDDLFPGDAMRASTLKGLIVHTADDLGNPGPDYSYGWGLMNTLAAAELLKDYATGNPLRLTEAVLSSSTNTSDAYTFFSGGNEAVRLTLCWTDPPGSSTTTYDSRTSRLVNDLDLHITGPDGMHYPYKLSYANPSANATANSENNIDNVEQIYIASPIAGQYTITVDYDGLLTDGEQWYSLLISGVATDSDADEIPDYWETLYFGGPTNAVATADPDGDGSDNYSEYVAGTVPNDSNSVFKVVTYAPPATGSNAPFVVTWNPVEAGRIYNVDWSQNLVYIPFTNISGALPYPANSYTDSVDRTDQQNFYRVDVQLDQ